MRLYDYVLAFDPSGNFTEGKGTTGWVFMDANERLIQRGYISAKDYSCPEEYWEAHLELIRKHYREHQYKLIVVIEEYVLYRDQSLGQTNSKMETCRLIGVMQHECWRLKQPYSMQLASSVKDRWSDELLLREHIIFDDRGKLTHTDSGMSLSLNHTRDAFRHAIHYVVTRNKPKEKYVRRFNNNYPKQTYRRRDRYGL